MEIQIADSPPKRLEPKTELAAILEAADSLEIRSPESLTGACEILHAVKTRAKEVKEERDSVVKPLKAATKKIDGWFRLPLETFETVEGIMKSKIADYMQRARNCHSETIALGEKPDPLPTLAHGVSESRINTVVVTDPEAVPREFLVPDLKKIEAAIKAGHQVPGADVVQTHRLSVRVG